MNIKYKYYVKCNILYLCDWWLDLTKWISLNEYNDHNNQYIDIKIVKKLYHAIARAVSGLGTMRQNTI